MSRLANISYVYLRYQYFPFLLGGGVVFLCLPLIVSFKNLELEQSAQLIDKLYSLIGLVMMIPLFSPDVDKGALAVIYTRRQSYLGILFNRLVIELISVSIILLLFLVRLNSSQSVVSFGSFFFAGLANVLFLGGIGLIFSSLFDQLVLALMVPLLYYVANIGGSKYFGHFYLFSLANQDLVSKSWLALVGMLLIGISLLWRRRHV